MQIHDEAAVDVNLQWEPAALIEGPPPASLPFVRGESSQTVYLRLQDAPGTLRVRASTPGGGTAEAAVHVVPAGGDA